MAMNKTFDAGQAEQRIYEKWDKSGAFRAGANARDGADPFCIMIPPPNVTGILHIGHAFNNTLQDILIRWKRMQGCDVLWQPGVDHAGIATQMVVERELAETGQPPRRDLGREPFLQEVWERKEKYGGRIIEQLKRLGASCDWSRTAFTMSGAPGAPAGNEGNFHDAVIRVFVDMYDKGLIYRGKRLVNWDPHFETAISDLEVENIEVPGHMWHFKYRLAGGETYTYVERDADGNVTLEEERDYISIATTRPETMLGDGAVAVHPSDERYAPIVGKLCEIPVGPKEHRRWIPIITDEYPDPAFGSGAVKITGAHDFNDYQVARRNDIPMYRLMDRKGRMRGGDGDWPYAFWAALAQMVAGGEEKMPDSLTPKDRESFERLAQRIKGFTDEDQTPPEDEIEYFNLVPDDLRGLDRFEARDRVVEQITAEGLAVMTTDASGNPVPLVEEKPIMQPFGDRSKVVIEPMLTDQWFVDTAKIVGPAIKAVKDGQVNILPKSGEKVFFHWMENIEPWCISRQLWWGHRIPVWYGPTKEALEEWPEEWPEREVIRRRHRHNRDGKQFCAISEEEALAQARAYYGENVKLNPDDTGFPAIIYSRKRVTSDKPFVELNRDPDVLDTWFSSGLWPVGTLGWPEKTPELERYFPTSVLITGQDILFFWVARMMMMQLEAAGDIPFRTVCLHGLVRDAQGRKMSKSTGNVIDPLEVIDQYGADALRFANASMASLGGVLRLDMARIAGYRNFGTKLWNAARFAEMNGAYDGHVPGSEPPDATRTPNKWIIGEAGKLRQEVDAALAAFRFNDAAGALYAFVWGRVCDWYVEFSKPLLNSEDPAVVQETRATMAWVIDQCLILLHPIMPFITEELWGALAKREKMLIHADWPKYGAELVDAEADREMNWVISLIENIRSARAQLHVPAGLKIPMICQSLDAAGQQALARNRALIFRLARIDSLTDAQTLPEGSVTIPADGGTFALPLADVIDIQAEMARLEKSLQKLDQELGGLRGRLSNPKFVAGAPAEVVEDTRTNLAAREEEEAKLSAALDRLRAIA